MPRPNLQALPRPVRRCESRVFCDPAQPGVEVALTLRALDAYGRTIVADEASAFERKYCRNGFPLANEEVVKVTTTIAQSVCALAAMQEGDDPYPPEDLLGMMVNLPTAWEEAIEWANTLNGDGRAAEGNASGADTDTGSAPSSNAIASTP